MQTVAGEMYPSRIGKRNRPPSSCEPCRIRKYAICPYVTTDCEADIKAHRLKCNRALPCNTCIQRNKKSSCEYAANANRSKPSHTSVGDRLRNLEDAVSQCIQNGVSITPHETQTYSPNDTKNHLEGPVSEIPKTPAGSFHMRDGQVNYVDSNHWLSILDDIREVRGHLALSDMDTQETPFDDGFGRKNEPDLLFSPMPSYSFRGMLQSLPPRAVCDGLLSRYFNQKYMVLR